MPNGIVHLFSSIVQFHFCFKFWYIFFQIEFKILIEVYSGDSGQALQNTASDLGLHCLYVSRKKDARLIYVLMYCFLSFLIVHILIFY